MKEATRRTVLRLVALGVVALFAFGALASLI